jgi:hypothetical protein
MYMYDLCSNMYIHSSILQVLCTNCSSSEAETRTPVGIVHPSAPLGVQTSTTSSFPSARGRRRRGWVPRLCSTCTQPRSKYRRVGTLNRNSKMTKVAEIDVYNNSKILNFKPIAHAWSNWGKYDDL